MIQNRGYLVELKYSPTRKGKSANKAACVEVNAKNSYGGYTGFQQAMFVKVNGVGWKLMRIANVSPEVCINVLHSTIINQNL